MEQQFDIEDIASKIKSLPLIDDSVYKIMSLLNNPESNFESIVLRLSPDLTARFLTMANMAHYGRDVKNIHYAVRVLGYGEMKNILVSSILIDHLTRRLDVKNFSTDKFQAQAHFCAAVSRVLGEMMDCRNLEDLFTISILHNIGKLVIVVYFAQEHRKINELKRFDGLSAQDAELRVLGASHSEIGAMVLARFNIHPDICEAIRFHDTADRDISASKNFELEFIFRETAKIVGSYFLPDVKNPLDLISRLTDTVQQGQYLCRQQKKEKMRSRGYATVFMSVLTDASEMLQKDLDRILERRG